MLQYWQNCQNYLISDSVRGIIKNATQVNTDELLSVQISL